VLIVIDDLHQIDPGALAILKTVLSEIPKGRLMILINYEPVIKLDLDIRRSVNVVDLDRDETRLMASRLLNTHHLGPRLDEELWTLTAGRPLFLEAQIKAWQQKEMLESAGNGLELKGDSTVLPDEVRQLIISRLDRLLPDNRGLVQAAAVLRCDFNAEIISAITKTTDLARIEALLNDLVQSRVLNRLPDGTYCFHYGLSRMAMYESLNRIQRQKLHRAAADYWSKHPQADHYLGVTAYHLLKSGSPLHAQEILTTAAEQAEQNGDISLAIGLYTEALGLFPTDDKLRAEQQRLLAISC
jgi:predicted ATPase